MINYEIDGSVLEDELENIVTTIEGKILEGDEEEIEIGCINATYVDIITANETGELLLDVFNHYSAKLYKYYEALDDKKSSLFKYLFKEKDWLLKETYSNLFLINNIWISDAYRGRKLGLAAIYRIIQKFAHDCRFAILEAQPLQFTTKESDRRLIMSLDCLEQDEKKASAKLKNYYKNLGFEIIPHSNYMILDLDLRRPSLKDIGFVT